MTQNTRPIYHLYHYHCDDIDDRGWGCVFRSLQNAVALLGQRVSMRAMVDKFGKAWIEPAMLTPFIPSELESKTFLWLDPNHKDAECEMLRTTPKDYDVLLHARGSHMRMFGAGIILQLLDTFSVLVIDNGVLAYCVYREGPGKYYILDPHTTELDKVRRRLEKPVGFMEHCKCWMVIALKQHI